MRRLRRSIGIGAALSFLLLGAPLDPVAADSHGGPPAIEQGQGDEHRADPAEQQARAKAVEPRGNPASPASMRAGRLSCGDVITKNTTLVTDVGPCPGNGIIIGADNITLNLNGHTIFGTPGPSDDGTAAGIRLPNRTGVTVTGHPGNSGKTGTVTGFDAGVVIRGGANNVVQNLNVHDNVGLPDPDDAPLGDGILVIRSAGNRILNNVVTNNGIFSGIGVFGAGSNNNVIQGNTVEDTLGSTQGFPPTGFGIVVNSFFELSDRGTDVFGNQILDNVVRRSWATGIASIGNVGGLIAGNTSEGNGTGTQCFGIAPRPIRCFPTSDAHGISVEAAPGGTEVTRNTVENNVVRDNGGNGIQIGRRHGGSAQENVVRGNEALGNGDDRFRGPYYDLKDNNEDSTCVAFDEQGQCQVRALTPSCDANVWVNNVFETAFPACIWVQHGLTPPYSPTPSPPIGGGSPEGPVPTFPGVSPEPIPTSP